MGNSINKMFACVSLAVLGAVVIALSITEKRPIEGFGEFGEIDYDVLAGDLEIGQERLSQLALIGGTDESQDPFTFGIERGDATEVATENSIRPEANITLSAIWIQEGASLILANNRISEEGDTIGDILIDEIGEDGAWFSNGRERIFIGIGESRELEIPLPAVKVNAEYTQDIQMSRSQRIP